MISWADTWTVSIGGSLSALPVSLGIGWVLNDPKTTARIMATPMESAGTLPLHGRGNRLANFVDRLLDGVCGKMGIALRGCSMIMPQYLSNNREGQPESSANGCKGMLQVMETYIWQTGLGTNAAPGLSEID